MYLLTHAAAWLEMDRDLAVQNCWNGIQTSTQKRWPASSSHSFSVDSFIIKYYLLTFLSIGRAWFRRHKIPWTLEQQMTTRTWLCGKCSKYRDQSRPIGVEGGPIASLNHLVEGLPWHMVEDTRVVVLCWHKDRERSFASASPLKALSRPHEDLMARHPSQKSHSVPFHSSFHIKVIGKQWLAMSVLWLEQRK